MAANQPLAIRVAMTGESGTALDFDNVRFTSSSNNHGGSQIQHWGDTIRADAGPTLDPDGNQLVNVIEYVLGYDPKVRNPQASGFPTRYFGLAIGGRRMAGAPVICSFFSLDGQNQCAGCCGRETRSCC